MWNNQKQQKICFPTINFKLYMSHVMKVCLSCYLVLLSFDSKTRKQHMHTFLTWPISLNIFKILHHIDGLMQERRNSIANSLDLCLSYIKPSICEDPFLHCFPLFHVYISSLNCNKKILCHRDIGIGMDLLSLLDTWMNREKVCQQASIFYAGQLFCDEVLQVFAHF